MVAGPLVEAEWALWGKTPGSDQEHGVLDYSRGELGHDSFADILARFSPGNPVQLPQVTLSWSGGTEGARARLGIAIHEDSGRTDKFNRGIANTRYFCIPYPREQYPVSYWALYDAFAKHPLPLKGGSLSVVLSEFDPDWTIRHAGALDDQAIRRAIKAAALLLTGNKVVVTQADSLTMGDRLMFLDAVATFLPYGYRGRLTAATWTDSASPHRIKLSFARHSLPGAFNIGWEEPVVADSQGDYRSASHFDLLVHYSDQQLAAKIHEFAQEMAIVSFPRAADALPKPSNELVPWERSRLDLPPMENLGRPLRSPNIADLLRDCANSVEQKQYTRLPELLTQLDGIVRDREFGSSERLGFRKLINSSRLLDSPGVPEELQRWLYDMVLCVGYGSLLTDDAMDLVLHDAAGYVSPRLVEAMAAMSPPDPLAPLRLAQRVYGYEKNRLKGPEQAGMWRQALSTLGHETLAEMLEHRPAKEYYHIVLWEFQHRGVGEGRKAVGTVLHDHWYLTDFAQQCWREHPDVQADFHQQVLIAAYGQGLSAGSFAAVVSRCHAEAASAPLLAAAIRLHGSGAADSLTHAFKTCLEEAKFAEEAATLQPHPGLPVPPDASTAEPAHAAGEDSIRSHDGQPARRGEWMSFLPEGTLVFRIVVLLFAFFGLTSAVYLVMALAVAIFGTR